MDTGGSSEQVVNPTRRRGGCLKVIGITVAVIAVMAILAVVAVTVVMEVSSNRRTSGDAVDDRPEGEVTEEPPAATVPPELDQVEPVPEDEMLVSVARKPPVNPCADSGPDFDIEVMGLDGSNRRPIDAEAAAGAAGSDAGDAPATGDSGRINTDQEELWARLAPDRRRLVFYRAPTGVTGETCRYGVQELWIANVDGSGLRMLFSNEQKAELASRLGWPEDGALQGHADWAPDGRHLVMVLGHAPSLGPLPLLNQGETELFVMNIDTGDLRQVTRRVDDEGRGVSSDPSFTPDGESIIFVGCPDATPSCDDMQILSVPADAEEASTTDVVFDAPGRNGNDVYVSPDSRSISWMEVGALETSLFVAEFTPGREIQPSDAVLIDAHGGFANWSADSEQLIYSRLWLGDRFALYSNSFDGQPGTRVSPPGSDEVFMTPSP